MLAESGAKMMEELAQAAGPEGGFRRGGGGGGGGGVNVEGACVQGAGAEGSAQQAKRTPRFQFAQPVSHP